MTDNFEIPEDLMGSYKRVIHRAPEKLRPDTRFQQLTLLHLKVGGERLARYNTELFKLVLEEEKIFSWNRQAEKVSDENEQPDSESEDGDELAASDEEDDTDSSQADVPAAPEMQAGHDADQVLWAMNCWGDGEIF